MDTMATVEADKAWSIERHAIEPIPLSDRHGSPAELFRLWVAANVNYVVLLTGALAVTQGLSLWGAVSAILVGNLLGCSVLGLASIMGPRTGTAGIITSRTSFGALGAVLPIAISTLSALGWFSILSIVATQSLTQVFAQIGLPLTPFNSWIAMAIVLVTETLLAIYGHATIIAAEKWIALVLVALFFGLLLFVLPHVDGARAAHGSKPATFGTWLLVMGLIFSYPISWANFASDYSRYLPPETSWRRIALAAGGGQFVGLAFCETIGMLFALAVGGSLSDPFADLPKVLPVWYQVPFLLAVILGSIAANVPNGYTAGLGLLALRVPLQRVNSVLTIAAVTLGVRIATLVYGRFLDLYQAWLDSIIIWTCPWVAIVVVDYFLRRGDYDSGALMRWGSGPYWYGPYWYGGGIFWPGLCAFVIGLGAAFLFSNSAMVASPLMTRFFGGADLSFEAGLVAAGFAYWVMATLPKRQHVVR